MSADIAVIGTGYVGLTTAACLAHLGSRVVCADIDAGEGRAAAAGEIPILEDGLEELVQEGLASGSLRFVTDAPSRGGDVRVRLPLRADAAGRTTARADLSLHRGRGAARSAPCCRPSRSSSTSPRCRSARPGSSSGSLGRSDVFVVSNPEFLREGSAVHDFLHPDRIVIGSDDQAAAIRVASLYLGVAVAARSSPTRRRPRRSSTPATPSSPPSSRSSTPIAALCEAVGADVNDVVLGMGYDKRIGHEFLRPGPGLGRLVLPEGHPGARAHRRGRRLRLRPARRASSR